MAACKTPNRNYTWRNSEDFQLPDNSVWYGRDDDGSDIFCGKAWCEGEEVPAQVIPNRKECRVIHNGCEKVVPNCRKILVCNDSEEVDCHRRRDHCHRRRHCRCDDSSSSDSEEESSTTTKKSSTCNNESKLSEKSVKSCSSSTTTTVKKSSKKHHKKRESGGEECRYERRTRMVPKVTVQPRIEYVPKVTNERTVQYVQESYVTRVCGRRRCKDECEPCEPCDPCEPCEPCNPCEPCDPCEPCGPCDPCEPCGPCDPCNPCEPCNPCDPCDPCNSNQKDRTILYSAQSEKERSIKPRRCSSKSPSRKVKWI